MFIFTLHSPIYSFATNFWSSNVALISDGNYFSYRKYYCSVFLRTFLIACVVLQAELGIVTS